MHAALLTLVVAAGAGQVESFGPVEVSPTPEMGYYESAGDCSACQEGCGKGCGRATTSSGYRTCLCAWWGPMPQTCYAPRFGCYAGNNRHMHRYPAFHGYYHREPYNYRHLFEYPWHAAPHEPQDFFTHEVTGAIPPDATLVPTPAEEVLPGESGRLFTPPPTPVPSEERQVGLSQPAGLVELLD
jgi:hypothetical protein